MGKWENRFFKKISRIAAEILTLSIMARKEESYPYEIQLELRNLVTQDYISQQNEITLLSSLATKLIEDSENKIEDSDLNSILKNLNIPIHILNFINKSQLLKKVQENPKMIEIVKNLKIDIELVQKRKEYGQEIWKSITSIYQVINDLEKNNLIINNRTILVGGRSRKYYQITDEGREKALQMIIMFIELTNTVLPEAQIFKNQSDRIFQKHQIIFFQLIKNLFPEISIADFLEHIQTNFPEIDKTLHSSLGILDNPITFNAFLLQNDKSFLDTILKSLDEEQKEIFNALLIKNLNKLKKNIDENIKYFSQKYKKK